MADKSTPAKKSPAAKRTSFKTVSEASVNSPAARASLDKTDERGPDLGTQARAKAEKLADQAKVAAGAKADDVKDKAGHRISDTADTIRNAGREFGADSYQAYAADYLADSLNKAAERIRTHDLEGVALEASAFARRNPAVVLGGAALLGFAAARLLKASDSRGRA
ncbi:hypothetical protein SAMN05444004_10323 [Jannaschia faecimaris]|uniref:Uncharacterized protein n=1 Tax=Jannaschia faecimaris TaxID=1244108 RepID=A0A1H3MC99_9RHOB|nr:hypothetical protein [Jannaschia faecimaris]SDY74352.1 hypothetical protein SAMN05444004_10323 [Jannaschia faecimaris]